MCRPGGWPGLFDCHVHFMVDGDFSTKTHLESPFPPAFLQAAERMARTLAVGVPEAVERGVDLADDVVSKTRDFSQIHRDPVSRAINASWGA